MALEVQDSRAWKILLVFFGIALGILTCELGMRLLDRGPRSLVKWVIYRRLANTQVGYDLKPNSRQGAGGVMYNINSHGMRDREYLLDKGRNTYRIAVLGDSYTFGDGVPLEDTYVKQLEDLLNQNQHLRKRIEVFNLGVNGYNTVQELWRLKGLGLQFQPDLILLGYYLNDPLPVDLRAIFGGPGNKRLPHGIPLPFKDFLRRHSRLYLLLSSGYGRILQYMGLRQDKVRRSASYYLEYYQKLYRNTYQGWKTCRQALLDFHKVSVEREIPFLVVIFPALIDCEYNYAFGAIHEKVASFLHNNGIDVLDLLPAYLGQHSRSLWAARHNRHPNRRGHRIAAQAISDYIIAKGLILGAKEARVEGSPRGISSIADLSYAYHR